MLRAVAAGLAGIVFGLGLGVSQMVNPQKVLAFLDITGDWDPSLAFVMGGAVVVGFLTFRLVLRRPAPVLPDPRNGPFPFHRSFNVERESNASNPATIQNRTTILVSGQPSSSK